MPARSESERTQIARIAAHLSWANTVDPSARTAAARAALDAKFLAEAGGDPIRAEHVRKAYYARLALKSAQARRARRSVDAPPPTVALTAGGTMSAEGGITVQTTASSPTVGGESVGAA